MPLINKSCTASEGSRGIPVARGTCLLGFTVFTVAEGRKGRLQVRGKNRCEAQEKLLFLRMQIQQNKGEARKAGGRCKTCLHEERINESSPDPLMQAWPNCGPGAVCGLFSQI